MNREILAGLWQGGEKDVSLPRGCRNSFFQEGEGVSVLVIPRRPWPKPELGEEKPMEEKPTEKKPTEEKPTAEQPPTMPMESGWPWRVSISPCRC